LTYISDICAIQKYDQFCIEELFSIGFMEILKVHKIQAWDKFTIENEPIQSIDLMERASRVFTNWFTDHLYKGENKILIIASKGNNGGDGLAVARMLVENGYNVHLLICHIQHSQSPDFEINFNRLKHKNIQIRELRSSDVMPSFKDYDAIIDAIFGSGLSRPIEGFWSDLIKAVNCSGNPIYSIDIPSGMFGDQVTPEGADVIYADDCLSFERPKLSFFFPSNGKYLKNWTCRSIGLDNSFLNDLKSTHFYFDYRSIGSFLKKRNKFDHKGKFGKALIIGGQKGMIGASVLSLKSLLRTGTGLAFGLVPDIGYDIVQISVPEAMVLTGYGTDFLSKTPDLDRFDCLGIGPGLGTNDLTIGFLENVLRNFTRPVVLDADALNIIAKQPELLKLIPKNSILTPHPGEFERLFGKTENDLESLEVLSENAQKSGLYIILKGAHTAIGTPDGRILFNDTGNPGMATGGSGDVLTGIITGFLAQHYTPEEAALLGVHLHGLAGDYAAQENGQESMLATDIINNIGKAFKKLKQYNSI